MTLVDTSIWIDHLYKGNHQLEKLLLSNQVLIHPFIIGEISLGAIRKREEVLSLLNALPEATIAAHTEVFEFVQRYNLVGMGLGWIDVHVLASMKLSNASIMTNDKTMLNAIRKIDAVNQ